MVAEDTSIFLVIILSVGGLSMMTALLVCYVCIFRDLCCRNEPLRSKKGIVGRAKAIKRKKRKGDNDSHQKPGAVEAMILCDLTQQAESMPTESEIMYQILLKKHKQPVKLKRELPILHNNFTDLNLRK